MSEYKKLWYNPNTDEGVVDDLAHAGAYPVRRDCSACGFETELSTELRNGRGIKPDETFYFCKMCDGSQGAHARMYPSQYKVDGRLLEHISYCANAILKALKEQGGGCR